MNDGDSRPGRYPEVELFEPPPGTPLSGTFIGSPGMNVLPCERRTMAMPVYCGQADLLDDRKPEQGATAGQSSRVGVRPEFVDVLQMTGIPATRRERSPMPAGATSVRTLTREWQAGSGCWWRKAANRTARDSHPSQPSTHDADPDLLRPTGWLAGRAVRS